MSKGIWITVYEKIENMETLKKYAAKATSAIGKYSGKFIVRGGKNIAFEGESFLRTVIWEFPSYEKALECHNSSEYKSGWDLAKKTTTRHMQVIEGFSIE